MDTGNCLAFLFHPLEDLVWPPQFQKRASAGSLLWHDPKGTLHGISLEPFPISSVPPICQYFFSFDLKCGLLTWGV